MRSVGNANFGELSAIRLPLGRAEKGRTSARDSKVTILTENNTIVAIRLLRFCFSKRAFVYTDKTGENNPRFAKAKLALESKVSIYL